ncbi:hypothetical protein ACB098_12G079200 [Castanea mollissima]
MVREKVIVSTRTLQWKSVESRGDSNSLYYGHFILSPLMKGQADTIVITMRRALLGEIEGTCITRAKSEKIPHEYSTIIGIQESVHEILMNLKEIVLRSNLYGISGATIYRRYRIKTTNNSQDGSYPIDAVFMPNEKQEMLFLEIWTNGSLTPKEALHEASRNLIELFIPFLHAEEEKLHLENNQQKNLEFIDPLGLLNNSQTDFMKMKHFHREDIKHILDILEIEKHFV